MEIARSFLAIEVDEGSELSHACKRPMNADRMESLTFSLDAAPKGVECRGYALKEKLLSQLPHLPELHRVPDAAFNKSAYWHESIGQFAAYERLPPWGEPPCLLAGYPWTAPLERRVGCRWLGRSVPSEVEGGSLKRGLSLPPASGRCKTPEELAFFFFQRFLVADPGEEQEYEGEEPAEEEEEEIDVWEEGEGGSPLSDGYLVVTAPTPPDLAAPRAHVLA